jgi:hypothetical protein
MRTALARTLPLMLVTLLAGTTRSFADEPRSATATAKWSTTTPKTLTVNISDLLTPAQREIVNSGFSTFTLFALSDKKIADQEALPEMRIVCSVKYDTWEEKYQLIKVDPAPTQTSIAKDYKAWADECLAYTVRGGSIIDSLSKGGTLQGILQIRQSSPNEAAKIKNWLVRQQSGFMQGLYAHMLGDFQFKGTVHITISVPSISLDERGIRNPAQTKGI